MRKELFKAVIAVAIEETVRHMVVSLLPFVWLSILIALTWEILNAKPVRGLAISLYGCIGAEKRKLIIYPIVAIIGAGLTSFYWWGIQVIFRAPIEGEPVEHTAGPPTPVIQLVAGVVMAADSFNGSSTIWISYNSSYGLTLSPANAAVYLKATNITDHPVRVLDVFATVGEDSFSSRLRRLPLAGMSMCAGAPPKIWQMITIVDGKSVIFEENAASPITARESIVGWVLFEYPEGLTHVDARTIKVTVHTDYGDIPSAQTGISAFGGGGAVIKRRDFPLNLGDFHIERYSSVVSRKKEF